MNQGFVLSYYFLLLITSPRPRTVREPTALGTFFILLSTAHETIAELLWRKKYAVANRSVCGIGAELNIQEFVGWHRSWTEHPGIWVMLCGNSWNEFFPKLKTNVILFWRRKYSVVKNQCLFTKYVVDASAHIKVVPQLYSKLFMAAHQFISQWVKILYKDSSGNVSDYFFLTWFPSFQCTMPVKTEGWHL